MSGTNEVRVTDPRTGGQKGSKDERFDLIPARPMQAVARHYGIGAKKYDDDNWRLGYSWRLSIASLERHLNAFKAGEDIDHDVLPDGTPTESPHMAAVVFHALALLEFAETHPELDDRWKPEPTQAEAQAAFNGHRPLEVGDRVRINEDAVGDDDVPHHGRGQLAIYQGKDDEGFHTFMPVAREASGLGSTEGWWANLEHVTRVE